jgi:hypothetical protein
MHATALILHNKTRMLDRQDFLEEIFSMIERPEKLIDFACA